MLTERFDEAFPYAHRLLERCGAGSNKRRE
jgi:hypothetical protein